MKRGEVNAPVEVSASTPASEVPAATSDTERLDWIERKVCDVSRLGDSARTVRISWNNGADYVFVGPRYNASWRAAIDAAMLAATPASPATEGEPVWPDGTCEICGEQRSEMVVPCGTVGCTGDSAPATEGQCKFLCHECNQVGDECQRQPLRNPRMESFDKHGPLPGMIAAFEKQFGQSWTDKDWRDEASTWAKAWKAALAAPIEAETQKAVAPFAYATHHDEPMLFPTHEEALTYCDDDEEPIPLYTAPTSSASTEAVAALMELVALKDMKDRLEKLHAMGHGTDYTDYYRRQPLAWANARALAKKNGWRLGGADHG